jgi:hypothetical protein
MTRIRILPEHIANKTAAGEVFERRAELQGLKPRGILVEFSAGLKPGPPKASTGRDQAQEEQRGASLDLRSRRSGLQPRRYGVKVKGL